MCQTTNPGCCLMRYTKSKFLLCTPQLGFWIFLFCLFLHKFLEYYLSCCSHVSIYTYMFFNGYPTLISSSLFHWSLYKILVGVLVIMPANLCGLAPMLFGRKPLKNVQVIFKISLFHFLNYSLSAIPAFGIVKNIFTC